ncbi:MAG: peptide deformylase [Bacteroidota bacterium]
MILPIVAYGAPILRKVSEDITRDYPGLQEFIANMWETMYASSGVGLAAPQVNRDIRVFVMDSLQIFANMKEDNDEDLDKYQGDEGIKQVFINAHVIEMNGDKWPYNEGCLSIPKVREDVLRSQSVTLEYLDENFERHENTFTGITARVILHEYDHLEGKLFIDYLAPLKRKLLKGKLSDISKGKIKTDYRMVFPG